MRHRRLLAGLLLAAPAFALAARAPVVTLSPSAPTSADPISIVAAYDGGVLVTTQSHTIAGQVIQARFVQDGFDFEFGGPFVTSEPIGRLAPGRYTLIVTAEDPNAPPPAVQQLSFVVAAAPVPIPPWGLVALGAALLAVGTWSADRARR